MPPRVLAGAALALTLAGAGPLGAQTATRDDLRDLPSSADVFSLLETAEPLAVADRIDGGGLWTGAPGRVAARGASWTQAALRLDGLDLADPLTGGGALVLPWHEALDALDVTTGGARREASGPGPLVALTTPRPGAAWQGTLTLGALLGGGAAPADTPPAIARLDRWRRGAFVAAGPLGARAGLLLSGEAASSARFDRGGAVAAPSHVGSALVSVDWAAAERDRVRLTVLGQDTRVPTAPVDETRTEDGRAFLLGAAWERRAATGLAWTLVAGLARARADDADAQPRTIERLLDGPAALVPPPGRRERSRATLAGTASLSRGRHALDAGVRVTHDAADVRPSAPDWTVAERLDGAPARVWEFEQDGPWRPRLDELVLHVGDEWRVGSRVRLAATLPLQVAWTRGRSWTSLGPRLDVRADVAGSLAALGSWSRDVHRLPLSALAFGDPAAPRASTFAWSDDGDGRFAADERGLLVAREGPGAPVVSLDPSLGRPRTDEWRVGLEAALGAGVTARLEGIARSTSGLWESVDTGVTASDYDVRLLPDPAGDIVGAGDDQLLPVYDRRPESFGRDALLLTQPGGHDSLYEGVELTVSARTSTVRLLASATAHRSVGSGAFRGFRPSENDQGLVGELSDDPNADTYARGRLFSDRAFTIKIAGAARLSHGVRLGAVARYQDGQPFARVVIVPDLRQGPDFVMAIPRGRARFTYTLTVDARLEKVVDLGRTRASAVVEAFNLLDTANETEEDVVSGPAYRTPAFVQPPRTWRAGLRLAF